MDSAIAPGVGVPEASGAPSAFRRSGRKFSPTNTSVDFDKENIHSNVQIMSFEQPHGTERVGETELAGSPAPKLGRPGCPFRRSGRILKESRSEPVLSMAHFGLNEDVKEDRETMLPRHSFPHETELESESDTTNTFLQLSLDNQTNGTVNEGKDILAAIDNFESGSVASPDAVEEGLVLLDPLSDVSDEAKRVDSESPRVVVTFVGSNLAPGATLKKEKKRRRGNLFFRPSLESLLESEEVVLTFPSWIVPAPKFAKRAFPTESVVVKASVDAKDIDDTDVNSILAQQEEHMVGRLRKRRPSSTRDEEVDREQEEEAPLFRQDTYGKWFQAQCSSVCRRENSQACRSADYDRVFLAIETFDNEELKALTKEGVSLLDPSCLDKFENTPLMAAVMVNNKKIVKLLLKHGADLDAVNSFGNTALHFAVEFQLPSTTKYLLRKGVSRDIKNSLGMVAGERVMTEGSWEEQ